MPTTADLAAGGNCPFATLATGGMKSYRTPAPAIVSNQEITQQYHTSFDYKISFLA
jgi:hypothetical protein